MIGRILVLFALFTLTVLSAASAHEHGMGHASAQPTAATTTAPVALPAKTPATDQMVAWLAASVPSVCADAHGVCHNHSKFTDCTCPAACAGLSSGAAAPLLSSAVSASTPIGVQRLFATSCPPPTPPPRA